MSDNNKRPTLSISLKPVGGSKEDRIYFLAGWERDGKVSSLAIDRKIKQVALQMEDGSVLRVKRNEDGRWSHFVDVYDTRAIVAGASKPAETKPSAAPSATWNDDDIPF